MNFFKKLLLPELTSLQERLAASESRRFILEKEVFTVNTNFRDAERKYLDLIDVIDELLPFNGETFGEDVEAAAKKITSLEVELALVKAGLGATLTELEAAQMNLAHEQEARMGAAKALMELKAEFRKMK